MKEIELFHVGPQKSGTTWIFSCLREHPEVVAPHRHTVHYFDLNYHRGREWLKSQLVTSECDGKLLDPTPGYLRSPVVPVRIKAENPYAKIALSIRHPVARAFSHYWHEKKKRRYDFEFKEILTNCDLFANWMEPGFYATHLERYLECFPREQIFCQLYDQLVDDPRAFIRDLCGFYGIDTEFIPSKLGERLNEAAPEEHRLKRHVRTKCRRAARRSLESIGMAGAVPTVKRVTKNVPLLGATGRMERLSDQSPALVDDLIDICQPEIERLEKLLQLDLTHWRNRDLVLE